MKKEEFESRNVERAAAINLMEEYVKTHANYVAHVIAEIVPFFSECSHTGLQSCMNTVNVTFASIALSVVETSWMDNEDEEKKFLPVDAFQMKNSIYYLSMIINKIGIFAAMCESNVNNPAFKMCRSAYRYEENIG